eukprot:jgi/Undpi1/4805/HiC_scaffold_19.g08158.m1
MKISIKHPLLWVVLLSLLTPAMCLPDWLERIIMAPSLAPSQYKTDNSPSAGSSSTSSTAANTNTNSDTGSDIDELYILDEQAPVESWVVAHHTTALAYDAALTRHLHNDNQIVAPDGAVGETPLPRTGNDINAVVETPKPQTGEPDAHYFDHEEVPVRAWAAAHHDTAVAFDSALARQLQFEEEEDEFVLPYDALGETVAPQTGEEPETEEEGEVDAAWQMQLAQFATTLLLACFGLNDGLRAGCGGDGGGDGGGGGGRGPERREGGSESGRSRNTGDSVGSPGRVGNSEEDASIFDQVGDTFDVFMSRLGRGMMDALGFKDTDDNDHSDGPLPESFAGRIARWRKYAMSWAWKAHHATRATPRGSKRNLDTHPRDSWITTRDSKRDLDTLGWDLRRLSLSFNMTARIQRVIQQFLESCPTIGYTQGFDLACSAILKATGYDEIYTLELFNAWATAAGRVVTDENTRRKASTLRYRRAVQDLLERDAMMDIKRLSKAEQGSTLYTHVFHTLELPEAVQLAIIDKTLKAGVHGPGVSAWVATALLSIAQKDAKISLDQNLSKGQMFAAAAEKVSSFSDLEKAADSSLVSFMRGYRRALR